MNNNFKDDIISYNLYSGWGLYRLGDMIRITKQRLKETGEKLHYKMFPNSIATKYMKKNN